VQTEAKISLLNPSDLFCVLPALTFKFHHGSHIAFMCCVWTLKQRATFTLCNF